MPSASITARKKKRGGRTNVVRFRLGGRAYPVEHGGSFLTMREARIRRDLIAGELAAGRNPRDLLRQLTEKPQVRTFAQWAEAYTTSRPDIGDETRKNTASHLKRLLPAFGERDPATITPSDVQEWIGAQMDDLKASSLSRYLNTLRRVLDFADVDPNPARDRRVKLPRIEAVVVEPPNAEQVDAIPAHSPPRWKLALRTREQTGMRVGELVTWSGATWI
jgi:integrase